MTHAANSEDSAAWRLVTPTAAGGAAIAVIEIVGNIEFALRRLGLPNIGVGSFSLRDFGEVDRGIAARWSSASLHLMPHGGPAVLQSLGQWLNQAGLEHVTSLSTIEVIRQRYPEAADDIEALSLWVMSAAASPGAIDLLLQQADLWRGLDWSARRDRECDHRDRILTRLIRPPLVVIVGSPNVGKSRLLNALTGRQVSIVADRAGTTRDHVGAVALVNDLTVRLIDTPGWRSTEDPIEAEAQSISLRLLRQADLLISCGNAEQAFLELPQSALATPVIRIATKRDVFGHFAGADVSLSAKTGEGVTELSDDICERLVPRKLRQANIPWRFWDGQIASESHEQLPNQR